MLYKTGLFSASFWPLTSTIDICTFVGNLFLSRQTQLPKANLGFCLCCF